MRTSASLAHRERTRLAMAVMANADPIDVALDQIAGIASTPHDELADALSSALRIAALWRQVFEGAMRRADAQLAEIAAREHANAQRTFRSIERLSDMRAPPE